MIEILELGIKKAVGVRIKDKISAQDIENISRIVEEKFNEFDKLSIYVEVENFEGISIEAFFKDLKFGIKHFGKFDKKAVVTDKSWMVRLAEVSDKLFSSIEIRCFSFDDKEEALEWLSE